MRARSVRLAIEERLLGGPWFHAGGQRIVSQLKRVFSWLKNPWIRGVDLVVFGPSCLLDSVLSPAFSGCQPVTMPGIMRPERTCNLFV
jgi:hypothetical protein